MDPVAVLRQNQLAACRQHEEEQRVVAGRPTFTVFKHADGWVWVMQSGRPSHVFSTPAAAVKDIREHTYGFPSTPAVPVHLELS